LSSEQWQILLELALDIPENCCRFNPEKNCLEEHTYAYTTHTKKNIRNEKTAIKFQ